MAALISAPNRSFVLMLTVAAIISCCSSWVAAQKPQRMLQYESQSAGHPTNVPGPVPDKFTCPDGGCKFTNSSDGIETFELLNKHSNRLEIRYYDEYSSGRSVFQGQVKTFPPTHLECIMQIWGGAGGPGSGRATTFILRIRNENDGTLSRYSEDVLATKVYGRWVDVRVEHEKGKYIEAFIDGVSKGKWPDNEGDVTNYHKYGMYHTFGTVTTPYAKVQWRNVSVTAS